MYGVLRGAVHGSVFADSEDTDDDFVLPEDQFSYRLRAGFRWGGREPLMMPDLAMEVSAWYEGSFRTEPGVYGLQTSSNLTAWTTLMNLTNVVGTFEFTDNAITNRTLRFYRATQ